MKITITESNAGVEDVWEPPEPDAQYILGADVAVGATFGRVDERADWSTFSIWKREAFSLIQVAECRSRADNYVFGQMCAAWGLWYNTAIINVERNLAHGVIAGLRTAEYPQDRWFVPPVHASTMEALQGQWFFHKNVSSQKILLDTFKDYLTDRCVVRSARLIEEISTLRRGDDGKVNTNGKDVVIAAAMAVIVDAYTELPHTVTIKRPEEFKPREDDHRYDHNHWKDDKAKEKWINSDAESGFAADDNPFGPGERWDWQ